MDIDTYRARFAPDSAPGWAAIDAHLAARLGRAEPEYHYTPSLRFALGGRDPLDGISVYVRRDPAHLHFVSYGMSNLYYDEVAVDGEFSGWGFELTFRLALDPSELPSTDADVPTWPMNLMQNLARYVYSSEKWFEHGHYIDAKGPLKGGSTTDKAALAFCLDPELGRIETPHGRLDFLQMVGITAGELERLQSNALSVQALIDALAGDQPLLITSLSED